MRDLSPQMERMFNMLKSKGLFQEFKDYQDWVKQKHPNYVENKGRQFNNKEPEQKGLNL
jgi:hypothetical protein